MFRELGERMIANVKVFRGYFLLAGSLLLLLVSSCAVTKFSSAWRDDSYSGHPQKVLVINTFPEPATRRMFEDEFVRVLTEQGRETIASYTVSDSLIAKREAYISQAASIGADTVLVNQLHNPRENAVESPWGVYTFEDIIVSTKTEVYDVKSGRLILTVIAETRILRDLPSKREIRLYVNKIIEKLSGLGLFSTKRAIFLPGGQISGIYAD